MTVAQALAIALLLARPGGAQTGSGAEPVRYMGGVSIDLNSPEGKLRPAIGVENRQVFRANRTHPELGDGFGWTYNHAPMLAWWNGKFYLEYLSNPTGEHVAPGQTLVITSLDGRAWSKPTVVFPVYKLPQGNPAMMHQRMGFYVAPNGRLLVLAFYGQSPNPFGQGGIGRVVREAYKDGTYGPIYFIRYNRHGFVQPDRVPRGPSNDQSVELPSVTIGSSAALQIVSFHLRSRQLSPSTICESPRGNPT